MIAKLILFCGSIYVLVGIAVAIPFVLVGVGRIDPQARQGSLGFRVMIFPGSVLMWPILASRWWRGIETPPDEETAHRAAAQRKGQL